MDTSVNPRHMVVVGCLVRNGDDDVLLIRHYKRGWEIPQGRVEEGESILGALHREVREEAGVEVLPGPLAAVWSKLSPPHSVIFTFLARYQSGELRPSDETPELGWFPGDKALDLVTHPVNRDRLQVLLGFSGKTVFGAYATHPYHGTIVENADEG
jgi:8-oxo-dGTP diphosphatase